MPRGHNESVVEVVKARLILVMCVMSSSLLLYCCYYYYIVVNFCEDVGKKAISDLF